MAELPVNLEHLADNARLLVRYMRDTSSLAEPALREEILVAATELESQVPKAIREFVDGMAVADRMMQEADESNRNCDRLLQQYRTEAESGFPSHARPALEVIEPVGWNEARERLLDRLQTAPPPPSVAVELKDWAYDSLPNSSLAASSSSIATVDSGSAPIASAPIGGAKGWSDWIASSQSLSISPVATPASTGSDKPKSESAPDNPWLKAWKPPEK